MTQESNELDNFSELERKGLENESFPDDINELEEMLSEDGFDLSSAKFQRELQDRLEPTRERIEEKRQNQRKRPEYYNKIRNAALNTRDSVSLIFAMLLMAIMPFAGTVLLFVSEAFSAGLGATTFLNKEGEVVIAWTLAVTLTAFFFSLEWRYAALLHKHGKPKVYKPSLALFRKWAGRFFNWRGEPEEREDSHQLRETRSTARWTMFLIIVLGVLGRLFDELATYADDSWYEGFVKIVLESNPQEFLEYLGGALVAFVLLIGTRYILGMIYEQWVEVGGEDVSFFDSSSMQQELQQVHVRFLQNVARQRYNRKKGKLIPKYEGILKQQNDTQETLEFPDTESETAKASNSELPEETNDNL